jgi:hypothetical protein
MPILRDFSASGEKNRFSKTGFFEMWIQVTYAYSGFGGIGLSVLAFSTQVRGFKPSQSRPIFKGEKSSARLPSEGK